MAYPIIDNIRIKDSKSVYKVGDTLTITYDYDPNGLNVTFYGRIILYKDKDKSQFRYLNNSDRYNVLMTEEEISEVIECESLVGGIYSVGVKYIESFGWGNSVFFSEDLPVISIVPPNSAPSTPPSISVSSDITPSINDKLSVSWEASTDIDENLSGYQLERAWDGANSWTQVYKGSSRNFTDTIPRGEHDKVKYRVRAYDSQNAYSGYKESQLVSIINNNIPEIVIETEFAEVTEPFSVTYRISDDDYDPVTIVERLNDAQIRTLQATLDSPMICQVDKSKFMEMLNGDNSIAIQADDGHGGKNAKSIQFIKNVREVIFEGEKDLSEVVSRNFVFTLRGNIPEDCLVKFEIERNGGYIDITSRSNKLIGVVTNFWDNILKYRISIVRGESDTQGNISQIMIGII